MLVTKTRIARTITDIISALAFLVILGTARLAQVRFKIPKFFLKSTAMIHFTTPEANLLFGSSKESAYF